MSAMLDIARQVAARHRLRVEEMLKPCRERRYSWPRQEAMHLMVRERRWSLPRIGMFFGVHHTTILYGARQHAKREREKAMRDAAAWRDFGKSYTPSVHRENLGVDGS